MTNAVSIPGELFPKISKFTRKKIGLVQHVFRLKREIMDFTMGLNQQKLKLIFWAKKSTITVLEYNKRCGKATLGGGYVF